MKHTTLNHIKAKRLTESLDIRMYQVAGILEMMWLCARETYPSGFLPMSAEELARELHWDGEPTALVDALVDNRWLHEVEREATSVDSPGSQDERGFVIHDWSDHCDDTVHRKLARLGILFWNGAKPSTSRLAKTEKDRCEALLSAAVSDYRPYVDKRAPGRAHDVRPIGRLPGAQRAPSQAEHVRPTTPHHTTPHQTMSEAHDVRTSDAGGGGSDPGPPDPPPPEPPNPNAISESDLGDRSRVEALTHGLLTDPTSTELESSWQLARYAVAHGTNPPGLWRKRCLAREWPADSELPPDHDARNRALEKRDREWRAKEAEREARAVSPEEAAEFARAARSNLGGPSTRPAPKPDRLMAEARPTTEEDRAAVEEAKRKVREQAAAAEPTPEPEREEVPW